ncbi:MAG: O-antigen ligase family protein [Rickettsiaceae bacterium]|nr:O-antigen ligase family protein [Rickettsiaceae bacterium]
MPNIFQILLFLVPSLCMPAGLVAGPLSALIFALIIFKNVSKIDFSVIQNYKAELLFLLWILISCKWSIDQSNILYRYLQILLISVATIYISNIEWLSLGDVKSNIYKPLFFGSITGVIVFLVEMRTEGTISTSFRSFFYASNKPFALYFLDRGCAILSLISWPILYYQLISRKYKLAFVMAASIAYLLSISDSFSSYIGFIFGLLALIVSYLTRAKIIYFAKYLIMPVFFILPILAYIQSPEVICKRYPTIPDSAKHRLFIWQFTSMKISENPVLGYGFESSRSFPINEEKEFIYYNQYKWSPLPLHPHNNPMQIFLELGVVGLVFFSFILYKILAKIHNQYLMSKNLIWTCVFAGCFVNYMIISMVSFGVWQIWWVAIIALTIILAVIMQKVQLSNNTIHRRK